MKISMWIIRKFLEGYHPVSMIHSGKMELRNVRILSENSMHLDSNLYLERAEKFIDGEKNKVICVHKQDMILLDTDDMEAAFNTILDCFDFYNLWEEQCEQMIQEKCSLQQLLDFSRPVFDDTILIVDDSHHVQHVLFYPPEEKIAFSDDVKRNIDFIDKVINERFVPLENVIYIRKNNENYVNTRSAFIGKAAEELSQDICVRLCCGNAAWGYLIQTNILTELSLSKVQLLEEFGSIINRWIEKNNESCNTENNIRDIFKRVLLEKDQNDIDKIQLHLNNMGWSNSCYKFLFQIIQKDDSTEILQAVCGQMNNGINCMAIAIDTTLFALYNMDMEKWNSVERRIKETLRTSSCLAGASYPFTDLHEIVDQRILADTALHYGNGKTGEIYYSQDYTLLYLADIIRKNSKVDISHPIVKDILRHDRKNKTAYAKTLYYYLYYQGDYRQTAKKMFIHRNTVQYRIERIKELFRIDFENREVCIHIFISLYMKFNPGSERV